MIVSHKYQFIFIKTTKTAGTSLEIALSQYCVDGDLITPIRKKDEDVRQALGYRGPQNYFANRKSKRLHNHSGALAARRVLGEAVWNTYFKFCVVRNPWDRFLSFYYWRFPQIPRPTILEVIKSTKLDRLNQLGYQLYTQQGKLAVDRVYRFEKLPSELLHMEKQLDLPGSLNLPATKVNFRPTEAKVDTLTLEQKLHIAREFEAEIALMNWSFPE